MCPQRSSGQALKKLSLSRTDRSDVGGAGPAGANPREEPGPA
jgi:hypothetical protein